MLPTDYSRTANDDANLPQQSFSNRPSDAHAGNMQFLTHQVAAADLTAMDEHLANHDIFRTVPHGLPPTAPALGFRPPTLQPATLQPATSQPGLPMIQQPHPGFSANEFHAHESLAHQQPEHAHQHPGQFRPAGNWMPFRPGPMIPQVPPMQQLQRPTMAPPAHLQGK
jgi:hypothetical protein